MDETKKAAPMRGAERRAKVVALKVAVILRESYDEWESSGGEGSAARGGSIVLEVKMGLSTMQVSDMVCVRRASEEGAAAAAVCRSMLASLCDGA